MKKAIKKILSIDYHRNGICGNGFYAVIFVSNENPDSRFVASVFSETGSVSVLELGMLAEGNIRFGQNSWRGDHYEDELRAAIKKFDKNCDTLGYEEGRARNNF